MSILSGFFKTKKYRKTPNGYKLQSLWTSSETVEMGDGNTVETNLGAIQGITSSLATENDNYALSATAGKNLQDQITTVNTDLEYKTYAAATGDAAYFTADIICIKQGNTIFINGTIKVLSNVNGNAIPVILPYGFTDQSARWHNIQMTNISTWEKYDAAYIVDRHIVTRGDVSTLEAGTYIVDQVLCDYKAIYDSTS